MRCWVVGNDPRRYGFESALWTRQIVSELVQARFGVRLGLTAIGELLNSLGITPQKPLRRAYERSAELVQRWREEDRAS